MLSRGSLQYLFALSLIIFLVNAVVIKDSRPYSQAWRKDPIKSATAPTSDLPEFSLRVPELVTSNGYPFESHPVTTSDGYILGLQRIPHGRTNKTATNRPVVFVQHCFASDSSLYLLNERKNNLPYLLADAGADVWLGNIRGNNYSQAHTNLSVDSDAFWSFSDYELANIDLPAMIDYVRNYTGSSKVFYIGFSQGASIVFAGCRNSTLASKIRRFYALSPVVYLGNTKNKFLQDLSPIATQLVPLIGIQNVLTINNYFALLGHVSCLWPQQERFASLCFNLFTIVAGHNPTNLALKRLPVYLNHVPSSTSVFNFAGVAQAVVKKNFQAFDYGDPTVNTAKYGQATPPVYNLRKFKLPPTVIYAAPNDWYSTKKDVDRLINDLKNNEASSRDTFVDAIYVKDYDHADIVWGKKANVDVFKPIINDIFEVFDSL